MFSVHQLEALKVLNTSRFSSIPMSKATEGETVCQ